MTTPAIFFPHRTVTLLVGVPGSGKSTYLRSLPAGPTVCSADSFFTGPDGAYHFDPLRLGEAHGACVRRFVEAVTNLHPSVVVDNTNSTLTELAPYVSVAAAYGYRVRIVRFRCDPEVAASRNAHGVPLKSIRKMDRAIEKMFRAGFPSEWAVEMSEYPNPSG